MTNITIDKNIPIPVKRQPTTYPWTEMEIGDSFFIPGGNLNTIRSSARSRQRHKEYYVLRTVVENGVKGVRVWRTDPKPVD